MAVALVALEAFIAEEVLTQIVGQIVAAVVGAALAPELLGLQEEAFRLNPSAAISPADAVEAVIKGHIDQASGAAEAQLAGLNNQRFQILVDNAGDAPAPGLLLELWRRGVIPEKGSGAASVSAEQGIREGRTKNKWIEPLKALRFQLPSPDSALEALLEGQTDEITARALYAAWGGAPEHFTLMFNTRGTAPSPLEAAEMARRNIIPWDGEGPGVVSYRQAFLEGPWRNKWELPFRSLADYIPPPRTVTAMVREGALSDDEALQLFKAAGLTPVLAGKYLAAAHHQKVAASKELAKGDVIALYTDQLIDAAQATAMLGHLGYNAQNAAFELGIADFRLQKHLIEQAMARLRTLYIAHKLDKPAVQRALDSLGLTPAARDQRLTYWDLDRQNNVALLSAAELAQAVKAGYLDVASGLAELTGRGYSDRDAWIYLSIHLKAPATANPPPGIGPPAP